MMCLLAWWLGYGWPVPTGSATLGDSRDRIDSADLLVFAQGDYRAASRGRLSRLLLRHRLALFCSSTSRSVGLRFLCVRPAAAALDSRLDLRRSCRRRLPGDADRRWEGRCSRAPQPLLHVAHGSAVVPARSLRRAAALARRCRCRSGSEHPRRVRREPSAVPSELRGASRSDRGADLSLGGDRLDGVPDRALAEALWAGHGELDGGSTLRAGTLPAALPCRRPHRFRPADGT